MLKNIYYPSIFALILLYCFFLPTTAVAVERLLDRDTIISSFKSKGTIPVIVTLDVDNWKDIAARSAQQTQQYDHNNSSTRVLDADQQLTHAIHRTADDVLVNLRQGSYRIKKKFSIAPAIAMTVNEEALNSLLDNPQVLSIQQDELSHPIPVEDLVDNFSNDFPELLADESIYQLGVEIAWSKGYTGKGTYIAILDTGILTSHEMFEGKHIVEACFSSNNAEESATTICPNGMERQTGAGAALPNAGRHGTHVAGIAAGDNSHFDPGEPQYGVAPDADILAIQIFSKFTSSEMCGSEVPCYRAYASDEISALEYVYSLRNTHNIAAINLSIGGGWNFGYCDNSPTKTVIDQLKAVNIATVIAMGNNGYCSMSSSPACVSSAISVGSTDIFDHQAYYSNYHEEILDLFAPGSNILSAVIDDDSSYASLSGTSMATPQVAGAFSILRQANRNASVDFLETALKQSGTSISSECVDSGVPHQKRINIDGALSVIEPCKYSLSQSLIDFSSSGGKITIEVIPSRQSCGWSVSESIPWLEVTPKSSVGTSTISITAFRNPTGVVRKATLHLEGHKFEVRQSFSPISPIFSKLLLNSGARFPLAIAKSGSGTGIVTSSPDGIFCGPACNYDLERFAENSIVTLFSQPSPDSTFSGWSGGCSGTGPCQITMDNPKDVIATYTNGLSMEYLLLVNKNGTGTVSSIPAGIDCETGCDTAVSKFPAGTQIELTAIAPVGQTFSGWSGACSGQDNCQLTINSDTHLTATFTAAKHTLTLNKIGSGKGIITSSNGSIKCGESCTNLSSEYSHNSQLSLSASPLPGSTFSGWIGACTGKGRCNLNIDQTSSIGAIFIRNDIQMCGETWEWLAPFPHGNSLNDISWNGSIYVAAGDGGTIQHSDNLQDWQIITVPKAINFKAIEWDGKQFVALDGLYSYTSNDGKNWVRGNSIVTFEHFIWANNQFIGVGSGGRIKTSIDGISWKNQTSPTSYWLNGIAWSGSTFVIVGDWGTILTSNDGSHWQQQTINLINDLEDVIWDGSQFIAVGKKNTVLTSGDGVHWNLITPQSYSNNFHKVIWDGSRFLAIGGEGEILLSGDGINWTSHYIGHEVTLKNLFWDGNTYIAVGKSGTLFTSSNGTQWTRYGYGAASDYKSLLLHDTKYYLAGWDGIAMSSDAKNWTTTVDDFHAYHIDRINGQYIAVGIGNSLRISEDGENWSTIILPSGPLALRDMASNSDIIIAVGSNGYIYASSDGEMWTRCDSGTNEQLKGITWSGSEFYAAGSSGVILRSSDGLTWSHVTIEATSTFYDIIWTGDMLLAVGSDNFISLDGTTWHEITAEYFTPSSILKTESQFIAANPIQGYVSTSLDGISWSLIKIPATFHAEDVDWDGEEFILVGSGGTILRSTDCSN